MTSVMPVSSVEVTHSRCNNDGFLRLGAYLMCDDLMGFDEGCRNWCRYNYYLLNASSSASLKRKSALKFLMRFPSRTFLQTLFLFLISKGMCLDADMTCQIITFAMISCRVTCVPDNKGHVEGYYILDNPSLNT